MNKLNKNNDLYFLYKDLLTKNQQDIYEMYYFEDMSIVEIGMIENKTKTAIFKTINTIDNKLFDLEKKLKLNKKKLLLDEKLKKLKISSKEREEILEIFE